jgi:hypothetical protein
MAGNSKICNIRIYSIHLINNLIGMICDEVSNMKVYKTQGTPRFKVPSPVRESGILDDDLLKCYLFCVAMLFT